VSISSRLRQLEARRPACTCRASAALVRLAGEDEPPAPGVCEKCGRPEALLAVREVVVVRREGGLAFVSPAWATYLSAAEAAELVHAGPDSPLWAEAEARARGRRERGEVPFYIYTRSHP
jgi:hypothetical protein